MTKDSDCLGVINDYTPWDRQTDKKNIATTRLNRPWAASLNIYFVGVNWAKKYKWHAWI